jgi:hypothetical protein
VTGFARKAYRNIARLYFFCPSCEHNWDVPKPSARLKASGYDEVTARLERTTLLDDSVSGRSALWSLTWASALVGGLSGNWGEDKCLDDEVCDQFETTDMLRYTTP